MGVLIAFCLAFSYAIFALRNKQRLPSMLFGALFSLLFVVGMVCGEKTFLYMQSQPYLFVIALLPLVQFIISTYLYGFSRFIFWWFVVATLDLMWFDYMVSDMEKQTFYFLFIGACGVPWVLFAMALYLSLKKVRFPKTMGSIFWIGVIAFIPTAVSAFLELMKYENIWNYVIPFIFCLTPFAFLAIILFYIGFLFTLYFACMSD